MFPPGGIYVYALQWLLIPDSSSEARGRRFSWGDNLERLVVSFGFGQCSDAPDSRQSRRLRLFAACPTCPAIGQSLCSDPELLILIKELPWHRVIHAEPLRRGIACLAWQMSFQKWADYEDGSDTEVFTAGKLWKEWQREMSQRF